MNQLALIIELHHPLPGAGESVGPDWAAAAADVYWPIIRTLGEHAERGSEGIVTLAVSPCWSALAADPLAQTMVRDELDTRAAQSGDAQALREFVVDRWKSNPISALQRLGESGALELIPTTSSPTWLPAIAWEPIVARAQVALAVADHAQRFGSRPVGIWLPFLSYLPGLETVLAGSGLRYFGVSAESLLRGTVLPAEHEFGIVVTPPGVAAFGVSPTPTQLLLDPARRYAHDPRYADPARAPSAAVDHATHFMTNWLEYTSSSPWLPQSNKISVAAFSAHALSRWPHACDWLDEVLRRLRTRSDWKATTPDRFLGRFPEGALGRPGPATGGLLSVRPGGSDLFDRCGVASETLAHFVELRHSLDKCSRRAVAQMTRSLLRAQALDWDLPPGMGIGTERGLSRASRHLAQFHELAGLLASGHIDLARLAQHEAGPAYLPDLDLELLARN